MNKKYGIQEIPTDKWNRDWGFEVWSALEERVQIEAKFHSRADAEKFIEEKEANQGTPMTMAGAIDNALDNVGGIPQVHFCAKIVSAHIRDFMAQIVGVEMIRAESDETIKALESLMNAIDKKPSLKEMMKTRKLPKEARVS